MKSKFAVLVLLLSLIVFAEDQKTTPPPTPPAPAAEPLKPVPVPDASQLKVLKAQHTLDDIVTQMKDLEQQFTTLRNQATAVNDAYGKLIPQKAEAEKLRDGEITAAMEAIKVDKSKFDYDIKTGTAVPKSSPTPPAAPSK